MRNALYLLLLLCGAATAQCTYSLSPTSLQAPALGGSSLTVTMTVVSGQNCTRNVISNASWITVTFGATGTGNGSFGYSVDPNTGATSRTGTITAAGQTFTVNQDAPVVTLNPMSATFPASGGTGTFTVTSGASNWTAQPAVSWIQITANPSGSPGGTTTVSYSVASNPSTVARDGSIQVGAQLAFGSPVRRRVHGQLNLTVATIGASGGTGSFTVTSLTTGCTISALPSVPWIAAFTGAGNTVTYNVSANSTTQNRTGTIAVADKTFTITQAGQSPACTFALSTASAFYPAAGRNGTVSVTTSAGCAWTAVSNNSDWLKIVSAGGPGNGIVAYTVNANSTPVSRTGTLTIAGATLTVTEAAPDPNAVLLTAVKNAASYQEGAVAPGEFVVLGGSNIGPAPVPLLKVTATVGGVPAAVQYAGAAPTLVAGVLQVNVTIPDSVPSGNAVLVIQSGTKSSQPGVTVAIR